MTSPYIRSLKAEAKRLYNQIENELDTVDCGITLLCYLRPSVAAKVTRFDKIVAELKTIDPTFPRSDPDRR